MISPMHISQDAHALVVSYPVWMGAGLLALAALLAAYTFRARGSTRRRSAIAVATLLAVWAGGYFLSFKATVTKDGGTLYAFLRYDYSVRWKDAADIYMERRGGNGWHIVVLDARRRAYDFDVTDLSLEDRDRVMAAMVDYMPASAFHREPSLLRREARDTARPAGFFGDQQI